MKEGRSLMRAIPLVFLLIPLGCTSVVTSEPPDRDAGAISNEGGAPQSEAGAANDAGATVTTEASAPDGTTCAAPSSTPGPSDLTTCAYAGETCGPPGCTYRFRYSCPKDGQPRDVAACIQVGMGACCTVPQCYRNALKDFECVEKQAPVGSRNFWHCPEGAAPIKHACSTYPQSAGGSWHCCQQP